MLAHSLVDFPMALAANVALFASLGGIIARVASGVEGDGSAKTMPGFFENGKNLSTVSFKHSVRGRSFLSKFLYFSSLPGYRRSLLSRAGGLTS